jgi:hypothetical protein
MQRNKRLLYKFLHRAAKTCPGLRENFRDWCNNSIREFRVPRPWSPSNPAATGEADGGARRTETVAALGEHGVKVEELTKEHPRCTDGAGAMSLALSAMFAALPPAKRLEVASLLDKHKAYLEALQVQSTGQMQTLLDGMKRASAPASGRSSRNGNSGTSNGDTMGVGSSRESDDEKTDSTAPPPKAETQPGPGLFLVRWQDLMDEALLTPTTPGGKARSGRDVRNATAASKPVTTTGGKAKDKDATGGLAERLGAVRFEQEKERERRLEPPDVTLVVETLGPLFREMLQGSTLSGRGPMEMARRQ